MSPHRIATNKKYKIKKYRKKPVVIEAIQLTNENYAFVDDWIQKGGGRECELCNDKSLLIHTLEGNMIANSGDWIIKGVKDEFYPCKSDIFEMTYEEVKEK